MEQYHTPARGTLENMPSGNMMWPSGGIMRPKGDIMCPKGGIFSVAQGQGRSTGLGRHHAAQG